jgi:hypothetical protein
MSAQYDEVPPEREESEEEKATSTAPSATKPQLRKTLIRQVKQLKLMLSLLLSKNLEVATLL